MNENFNPEAIRQLLNRSLGQLDQPTLERLRDARLQALRRHVPHSIFSPVFAWIGENRYGRSSRHHGPVFWLAAMLLAVSLLSGIAYWQSHENGDDDIAILTDELPLDVYLDQ